MLGGAGSPFHAEEPLSPLSKTESWYRTLAAQEQLPTTSKDSPAYGSDQASGRKQMDMGVSSCYTSINEGLRSSFTSRYSPAEICCVLRIMARIGTAR
jgi:hypothetical protein